MRGSMRLEGGVEMSKALSGLSAGVSRRLVRENLVDAAEPMRERMEELAPVGDAPTHLRDQMVISVARDVAVDKRETAVAVGPSRRGFYGSFQELGTAHHAAQPFAGPAFDQTWLQVLGLFGEGLWADLVRRGVLGARRSLITDAPTAVQGEEV